ncbi:MAG: putative metalloprotease CJM1_0395 family protein [Sedimenticola sp.]|nr:putative metalloprotease CJM1_0395 family protein [Sedimenticola sp.]
MEVSFSSAAYTPLAQPAETAKQEKTKEESTRPAVTATEKKEALKDNNSKESQELRSLQARDREVRAHEQAHLSVAGRYATSGVNLEYQRGPDGQLYAVGGDVKIDTSVVPGDPKATEEKAETIRRAALAPANPSSQDRKVAAQASSIAQEARAELFEQNMELKRAQLEERSQSGDDGRSQLNERLERSGATPSPAPVEQIDTYI